MLTTNLEILKSDLEQHFKNEIDKVHEKVNDLEERYAKSEKTVTDFKNKVSDLETDVDDLKEENNNLKRDRDKILDRMEEAEYAIKVNVTHTNDLEQYTRRNNIRIYGTDDRKKDDTPQETTTEVIIFCRKHLGVTLERSDIDIAHRMCRFLDDDDRVVICRFVSRMDREEVIKRRTKLKGTKFVIRKDLTNKNAELLETVSDVDNVVSAWSDQGKIIVKLKNYKQKIRVNLLTDLMKPLIAKRTDGTSYPEIDPAEQSRASESRQERGAYSTPGPTAD